MKRPLISSAVVALALGLLAMPASADLSRKVIATFKGQIIVSAEQLQPAGNDKETIEEFKKARLKELKGEPNADEVHAWSFHYAAFLKATGSTDLKLEFHVDGKYVADQRLTDVDAKDPVLMGFITITEDDGPAKGKTYQLKLVAKKGAKETVVATTPITLN
jgi:hypothetical protein